MDRKKYSKILSYVGTAIFFLGIGWFFGRKFGEVYIELSKAILIIIGLILIIISFIPSKK